MCHETLHYKIQNMIIYVRDITHLYNEHDVQFIVVNIRSNLDHNLSLTSSLPRLEPKLLKEQTCSRSKDKIQKSINIQQSSRQLTFKIENI